MIAASCELSLRLRPPVIIPPSRVAAKRHCVICIELGLLRAASCLEVGRNNTAFASARGLQLTGSTVRTCATCMLNPPSTVQQAFLADEGNASSGAASKRTNKQQQRARKPQQQQHQQQQHQQQRQQQHGQPNQQRPGPEQQQLAPNQLSVATACLLQGQRSQFIDESLCSRGLAEALQAAHTCRVRSLRLCLVRTAFACLVIQQQSKYRGCLHDMTLFAGVFAAKTLYRSYCRTRERLCKIHFLLGVAARYCPALANCHGQSSPYNLQRIRSDAGPATCCVSDCALFGVISSPLPVSPSAFLLLDPLLSFAPVSLCRFALFALLLHITMHGCHLLQPACTHSTSQMLRHSKHVARSLTNRLFTMFGFSTKPRLKIQA